LRRDKTYFGLGNMDGNETTYRPIELHHQLVQTPKNQRLQSASIGNIQKVSGYPLFVEETPNLQTRQAPAEALENVMQKALKQYEDNLKQAKESQDE
jgi:hypothetical protein